MANTNKLNIIVKATATKNAAISELADSLPYGDLEVRGSNPIELISAIEWPLPVDMDEEVDVAESILVAVYKVMCHHPNANITCRITTNCGKWDCEYELDGRYLYCKGTFNKSRIAA